MQGIPAKAFLWACFPAQQQFAVCMLTCAAAKYNFCRFERSSISICRRSACPPTCTQYALASRHGCSPACLSAGLHAHDTVRCSHCCQFLSQAVCACCATTGACTVHVVFRARMLSALCCFKASTCWLARRGGWGVFRYEGFLGVGVRLAGSLSGYLSWVWVRCVRS